MEKDQHSQISVSGISKFPEMMREVLLNYYVEKLIICFCYLQTFCFKGTQSIEISSYLQMIRPFSMYFPVHSDMLRAIAIFIWKSVNSCRSFLSLCFSKSWMWCGLISLSSLCMKRRCKTSILDVIVVISTSPLTIFLYNAFSRYFLHLLACAFLLDSEELVHAWGLVWS